MKPKAGEPKAPPSKPDPKDELKTLPMPELEKRLGASPNGLTQAEAAKRLTQYGRNVIEEDNTNAQAEALQEAKAVEPNADAKPGVTPGPPETKDAPIQQVMMESKAEAEPALKPANRDEPVADLSAQIAMRAYELYEEGGRKDGAALKNWEKAEAEVRKDLAKAAAASKTQVKPMPVSKVESKPEAKDLPLGIQSGPQPETKALPKSEIKIDPQTEAHIKTASDVPPQLVKRVRELYEELGREEVGVVEEWERGKTQQERPAK